MKVLIVSFDKTLTEDLKKALSDHEVYVAKNSEEAIKMIPSDIEGVIYDAISGAISEEDINTLYTKKFSNARYVVLYDELFPVDENNIIVPSKLLVPRDESPKEIVNKLLEFPVEEAPPAVETVTEEIPEIEEQPVEELVEGISEESPEFEIETTAYETPSYEEQTPEELVEEPVTGSVEEALQELEATGFEAPEEIEVEEPVLEAEEKVEEEKVEVEEPEVKAEAPAPAPAATTGTGKILIVSFDQTLIDSIKAAFGQKYGVESVKTVKQAIEHGRDASVVVFDAISGVIAEKGLIELSNDQSMAAKSYVILVDDLFPINVDGIPLEKKVSVSRDTDPNRIKEIIEEQLASAPVQPVEEVPVEEAQPQEVVEEVQEEVQELEDVEVSPVEEVELPETVEEVQPEETVEALETPEEAPPPPPETAEEERIPALEALEKVMEEQEIEIEESPPVEELVEEVSKEEVPAEPVEEVSAGVPASVSVSGEELDRLVESAVMKALSEDRIREAVAKALEDRMLDIRDMVADVVRKEVEKVFEELDIRNLIRQATYQALRERLEELIT
ncbi:hypothetical protein [Hydrogenivirga sp. 128-5-R1-1]|uniref:hypothetical protein n=1 Tax=Hydrogenivirga sp. 128-5-R1-1 TaxID=392423 RepID=UPI00015F35C5|nr:hypothetical protein [Hydrogenivirga sp. 128-5-R1-1]EDP76358.1 hypothetical protein HG1285_02088 [Hydrogenivirga sp. 128-5-R1-1]